MSLELNKMAAAVLTAGVVAMSTGFIADLLVHPDSLEENAYPIQVADSGGGGGEAPEEPALEPVLPLLADADVEAGEGAFRACASCHTTEQGGAHRVGPNLWDIVGAQHAHAEDFDYSSAMQELSEEPWTYEALNAFLADPRDAVPGTRMGYNGMRDVEDRANLIAWLRTLSDDPEPLPSEEEIQEVAAEAEAEAPAEEGGEAADEPASAEEDAGGEAQETEGEEASAEAGAEGEQQADADTGDAGIGDSELLAAIADADPAEGENLVRRCAACHTFEEGGANRVGPNLWNVVGQPVAHLGEFNYSSAAQEMHDEGATWTYENLDAFLESPRNWMPGTRMAFPGIRDLEERAAVIAYLRSLSEDPPPIE